MILTFQGIRPVFNDTNFIAPSADVIGDVVLGEYTSVWFNTTIRGDVNTIRIGRECNVQDNSVIHVTGGTGPVVIGDRVTIGHSAIVHGCTVENNVLIGMGATILDQAVIGSGSIVGANALVTSRVQIPPGSLVLGAPAKVIRSLTEEEIASIGIFADKYLKNGAIYQSDQVREV